MKRKAVDEALKERWPGFLVSPTENSNPPARFLELSRENLHHGRLAGPAHGQIPDTDDLAAQRVMADDPFIVTEKSQLNDCAIDARELF